MQKTWAFLLLALFLISSVSALDTYKQAVSSNLILSDDLYSECAVSCTINIFYPNGTNLVNGITLTHNTGYSNITLTSSQTQTLGVYKFVLNGATATYNGNYEVTPSGFKSDLGNSIIGAVILILLFGIGAVLLFFSNMLAESRAWWYFGWVGIGAGLLIFYYDLLLGMEYLRTIAYATQTYDNLEFIFYMAAKIQGFIPYAFMAGCLYWWWIKRRNLKRAILDDDGYDGEKQY